MNDRCASAGNFGLGFGLIGPRRLLLSSTYEVTLKRKGKIASTPFVNRRCGVPVLTALSSKAALNRSFLSSLNPNSETEILLSISVH